MPAINLTLLRTQVQELISKTTNPVNFIKELDELLAYYQNYSLRSDKSYPGINFPKYNTPKQVITFLENELGKSISSKPELGLELATLLWNNPYLEAKLLAVSLMKSIPPEEAIQLISMVPEFARNLQEQDLFLPILINVFLDIRKKKPKEFIELLGSWLSNPDPLYHHWGLITIANLVQKPDDNDLPSIFEIIKPLLWENDRSAQSDVMKCINSLYLVSPLETGYFLEESLKTIDDEISLRNFSRSSRELQDELLKVIKPLIKSRLSVLKTKN
ncbi:MAG: DNA alkylation repair protein [Anaerolineales bacterium]